jgi:phosphoribosylanthranilate isomerase
VTSVEDALMIAAAGADAIGLNFFSESRRCVSHIEANFICHDLPRSVRRVGVFVNASADEVRSTSQQLHLDLVQLHGDETPQFVQQLAGLRIVRAFRLRSDNVDAVRRQIEEIRAATMSLRAILLDAYDPEQFGGTGRGIERNAVKQLYLHSDLPFVLAGGLTPQNVAEAIATLRPDAVDVASGVESEPGKKDRQLVEEFVAEAVAAFQKISAETA